MRVNALTMLERPSSTVSLWIGPLVPGLEKMGVHFENTSQLCAAVPTVMSMAKSREDRTGARVEGCCMKTPTVFFRHRQLRGQERSRSQVAINALMQSKPFELDIRLEEDGRQISLASGSILPAA